MALYDGCDAFWRFEEAAAAALDATPNGRDLTWNVSGRTPPGGAPPVLSEPQRVAGVVNYGVDLNQSYLWADYAAWNALVNTPFTWAGWIKPFGPGDTTDNDVVLSLLGEYRLQWNKNTSQLDWTITRSDGVEVTVSQDCSAGGWHFARCWLDPAGEVTGIAVGCGIPITAALVGGMKNPGPGGQREFCFGREGQSFAYASHWLDAWGLWSRLWDDSDIAAACATPVEYPFGGTGAGTMHRIVYERLLDARQYETQPDRIAYERSLDRVQYETEEERL